MVTTRDLNPTFGTQRRIAGYCASGIGLVILNVALREAAWQGAKGFHTTMEVAATLLASVVGALALVQYYSRKNNIYLLFIGTAFLGTAFVEAFHAVVASEFISPYLPPDLLDVAYLLDGVSYVCVLMGLLMSVYAAFRQSDITRKQLEASERKANAILDTAIDGIITMDPKGMVQSFNRSAERIFGYPAEEVLGRNVRMLMPDDIAIEHDRYLADYCATGEGKIIGVGREVLGRRRDGSIFPIELAVGETVIDGLKLFTGITRDITLQNEEKEKVRRHATVWKQLSEAVIVMDCEGIILDWNRGAEQVFGYEKDEALGQTTSFLHAKGTFEKVRQEIGHVIADGGVFSGEIECSHKDGSTIVCDVTTVPYRDEHGNIIGSISVNREVTAQRQAEESIRKAEQQLRSIIDHSPAIIYLKDLNSRILMINKLYQETYKVTQEDAVGRLGEEWLGVDNAHKLAKNDRKVIATRQPSEQEVELTDYHGKPRYMRSIKFPVFDSAGNVISIGGIGIDVTERKNTEDWLRKLSRVVEQSPASVLITDLKGNIEYVNPKFTEVAGYAPEEVIGRNPRILKSGHTSAEEYEKLWNTITSGGEWRGELHNRKKNGELYWESASISPIRAPDGTITHFLAVKEDITERKRTDIKLAEREMQFRQLVEMSPDAIYVHVEGRIVFVNLSALEYFGAESRDQMIGLESIKLICPEFREIIEARRAESRNLKTLRPFLELSYQRLDGSAFEGEGISIAITWDGQPALLIVARDITARKRAERENADLEQRLRQAQKMEALGTLAGGTAHEFNNLLLPIMSFTELTMRAVPDDSRAMQNLDRVLKSAHRAADLVEKILSFSRADEPVTVPIDLRRVVDEAVELVRPSLPATVNILTELAEENSMLLADETQLHQIIMNLAANAVHAMKGNVGELVISLANVEFDEGFAGNFTRLDQGSFARLSFRDNGSGIDEETLARLFEPFFTTKEVGKGTGLGLAMVHGIVAAHGGGIEVTSEPGCGTTVDVYLPLLNERETALAVAG